MEISKTPEQLKEESLVWLKEKYRMTILKLKAKLWHQFCDKYEVDNSVKEKHPLQVRLENIYRNCKSDLLRHLMPTKSYFPPFTETPEQIANEVFQTFALVSENIMKEAA